MNIVMRAVERRSFLCLVAGAVALPGIPAVAWAQTYPTQPVRIVVGFAVGSALDLTARIIAQWLSERLGQSVFVENRPGAGGNLGTEIVVRAPADGYTLLLVSSTNAISATLFKKLNFDFLRDIAPITSIVRAYQVIIVNPSRPYKTIAELISYAHDNPGKITMASVGAGSVSHLSGEIFKKMTGVSMVHVPYPGGANMITDLIGGQVDVAFNAMSASIEHIKSGRLRVLGVTAATRVEALPDVPTVGEFVPGYEVSTWNGLGAPKGTPAAVIEKLAEEISRAVADPKVKARLADLGYSMFPSSPVDFGRLCAADVEKWGNVISSAHIKPE